ncbi:GNAT family N-acetyltransferase [Candidatus Woesearchaeota archaeon]|nr:GNAT family N-acetyltransferase [Candidatus Woesearchaeota archaeon]
MFPLTITPVQDERDLRKLREFMLTQPQFYPGYRDWVDGKCVPRIASGQYKNLVIFSKDIVVGGSVYRFLDENNVEIKNFRIDSHYRNRDLGHFAMRQVEQESKGKIINLDVSIDNHSGVEFFIRNGFHIFGKKQLYKPGQDEYLMKKIA